MTLNIQANKNGGRGIEWTNATWNPVAGCPHLCRWQMPDGTIAECYAENIAEGVAASAYPQGFAAHYWKPQHLNSPKKAKNPLKIFLGSMADIFSVNVPDEQIRAILEVIKATPQHSYQLLTKAPLRSLKFEFPDNVWLGASMPPDFMRNIALSQAQKEKMLDRTFEALGKAKAKIKWISFEPLSWDVSSIVAKHAGAIQWAVIGAASNGRNYYPPSQSVFVALRDELSKQKVAMFYKGNLASLLLAKADWKEEFPEAVSND
jgi:protein gp37